jgi:hypothetical protein
MAKNTHPFAEYFSAERTFYCSTIETAEGVHQLIGVVPGYVGDECVFFMADGTYALVSPSSLLPLREDDLHKWVAKEWLIQTMALKNRPLDRAFRIVEEITREEVEDRLSRIYSVLKTRTFGLGDLELEIQTYNDSPYECEFVIGPFGLVLTETPAGMSWFVVHHPDLDSEKILAVYPWEGHWDAVQVFFIKVGYYAIYRAIEEYENDVILIEDLLGELTPFTNIPRKEN